MKPKAIVKIAVDAAMTVLFILQMGYHMVDGLAHEWLGVALCLLFILHHALNGGWHRGLLRGKYTPQRVLLTAVDALLTLAMVAIIASSIMVSRYLFRFLDLGMRALGREMHMVSTMWGFVLTGLHLGLHWNMFLGMAKRACKGRAAKTGVFAARICLAAAFIFGAYQFIARGLWMELFMLRDFAFLPYGEPPLLFVASYLCILAMWAAVTHYLGKALRAAGHRGAKKGISQ